MSDLRGRKSYRCIRPHTFTDQLAVVGRHSGGQINRDNLCLKKYSRDVPHDLEQKSVQRFGKPGSQNRINHQRRVAQFAFEFFPGSVVRHG